MTHILIVEDSDVDFSVLQRTIQKELPNTTLEHDVYGIEAIDKLLNDRTKPDLIISDQNLPQTSGVELCQTLRESGIETPIIIMTGGGSEEIAVEALKSGASDYIVKDVSGSWASILTKMIPTTLQHFQEKVKRKQAEEKLHQTAKELQARNLELEAFSRTVAHDLKSPVAQMIGFAELLREASPELLAQKKEDWINSIVRIGQKSASTIQALLDLARYEDDDSELQSFDMWFTFEAVTYRLKKDVEEKDGQLKFSNSWPQVIGNPSWIHDVWFSLIGNAIQCGGSPPIVEISWEEIDHRMIRFNIKDNGRELSPAEQGAFFDLGATIPERDISLSLGLSIVKKIIKKQGGEVGVNSSANGGTVVWFTLPEAANFTPQ